MFIYLTVINKIMEKTYDKSISTKNRRGEWVPSIPCPFYSWTKICECGEHFWTEKGYRAHYALEHILGIE